MSANYYCDYCEKRMKNDVNVRKKHNDGLLHKITKANYIERFRDPKEILEEQLKKTPCSRFLNGRECKFGLFCHFSHYTAQQIDQLRLIVSKRDEKAGGELSKKKGNDKKEYGCDNPWQYPDKKLSGLNLPPSLVKINLNSVSTTATKFGEWG